MFQSYKSRPYATKLQGLYVIILMHIGFYSHYPLDGSRDPL